MRPSVRSAGAAPSRVVSTSGSGIRAGSTCARRAGPRSSCPWCSHCSSWPATRRRRCSRRSARSRPSCSPTSAGHSCGVSAPTSLLAVIGAALVALGTAFADTIWPAVVVTLVVAFAIVDRRSPRRLLHGRGHGGHPRLRAGGHVARGRRRPRLPRARLGRRRGDRRPSPRWCSGRCTSVTGCGAQPPRCCARRRRP